jgi:SapC
MTRSVLLNHAAHHDLRIITSRGAAWGDDVMSSLVFPDEFRSVQAHYPIVFQKTTDGTGFQPVALFGLEDGQNLFLGADGWDAPYVPIAIERQPFLIGRSDDELLVHVDLDSPRVSRTEGEPVFLAHGGTTDFLERINSLLLAIHEGVQGLPAFIDALLAHDLLESFVLDVELDDGSEHRLAGLYTIDEDRLGALGGAALESLHAAGHLLSIYMVLASASHFRDLIERRNRRIPRIA